MVTNFSPNLVINLVITKFGDKFVSKFVTKYPGGPICLTDVSEARYLTDVSEDAAHNYLQMSSSRDLTDVTLESEDES